MRLRELGPQEYARDVLPLTFPLWAGRRTFDQYVAQTGEIARGAYGRRHYRTIGLYDSGALVSSFKRYERTIRSGSKPLRAIGFGAVFTPEPYRGRGYASVMLAAELDRARADGCHLAYLFSDIRPQFYTPLGFVELPSRRMILRADALPSQRIAPKPLRDDDWNAVRRCFEACESERAAAFTRGAPVWGWIALRVRQASEHVTGREFNLVLRRPRGGIRAYVLGARAPERDAYLLDEFGFADQASARLIPALLRAAAGDLRRVRGWMPPTHARATLPRVTSSKRTSAILMMAPLTPEGRLAVAGILAAKGGDFSWGTDHI
ncbi:MAG TPA: GNAT family N-acetyltransferase [Candidatus Cybelea sp.]|jgi:GNAT superfamily N-acetyltransferase|nr:GNAT family N-acetyltransferase [Candidatus Cybelea sp.]